MSGTSEWTHLSETPVPPAASSPAGRPPVGLAVGLAVMVLAILLGVVTAVVIHPRLTAASTPPATSASPAAPPSAPGATSGPTADPHESPTGRQSDGRLGALGHTAEAAGFACTIEQSPPLVAGCLGLTPLRAVLRWQSLRGSIVQLQVVGAGDADGSFSTVTTALDQVVEAHVWQPRDRATVLKVIKTKPKSGDAVTTLAWGQAHIHIDAFGAAVVSAIAPGAQPVPIPLHALAGSQTRATQTARSLGYTCGPSTWGAFSTQKCVKGRVHLDLTATNKIFDDINLSGDALTAGDIADFRAVLQSVAGPERTRLVNTVDRAVDGNALAYVGVDRRVITYAPGVNLAIVSVLWWP